MRKNFKIFFEDNFKVRILNFESISQCRIFESLNIQAFKIQSKLQIQN